MRFLVSSGLALLVAGMGVWWFVSFIINQLLLPFLPSFPLHIPCVLFLLTIVKMFVHLADPCEVFIL